MVSQMLKILLHLVSSILVAGVAYAAPESGQGAEKKLEQKTGICKQAGTEKNVDCNDKTFEKIEVVGRRWLPQKIAISDAYVLSRKYFDYAAVGNGNVTDQLTLLPGVQSSEDAQNIENQAEIKSQLISISGGRPSETGFYIEGQTNNSLLDPDSTDGLDSIDDVKGHPQQSFVNQSVVEQVTVYDSNIPVSYGGFSGGVVDVVLREPGTQSKASIDYRTSRSGWNRYHLIDNLVLPDEEEYLDIQMPRDPDFFKQNINLNFSTGLIGDHAIAVGLSHTESNINVLSLAEPLKTKRRNRNFTFSYQVSDSWFDDIRLRLNYSPYEAYDLRKNVLDSNFTIEGGATFASLSIAHDFERVSWNMSTRFGRSENSRTAPQNYFNWLRTKDKNWGLFDSSTNYSREGGYGDIEKQQDSLSIINYWQWRESQLWGVKHNMSAGVKLARTELNRYRNQTALVHKAPFKDSGIRCGEAVIDCVEQSFRLTREQLEQQLGEPLNLLNPDHFQAYQDNLLTRGQFFRVRQVYPVEHIEVGLNNYSAYWQNDLQKKSWGLRVGLRLDRNQFLSQWNLSPRTQLSYQWQNSYEPLLVFGASRYYASNMMSNRVRAEKRQYITQYRGIFQGQVQAWQSSDLTAFYQYKFDGLSTPYSDELSFGGKARLLGGIVNLKYVERQSRDQVVRGDGFVENGIAFINQTNDGRSSHRRYSFSYVTNWGDYSLMFNISKTDNSANSQSSEQSLEYIADDELVLLLTGAEQYQLLPKDMIVRRELNFSRPISANLMWMAQWSDNLTTSLSASYLGKYDTYGYTGEQEPFDRSGVQICSACDISELEYPVYALRQLPARTMLNAKLNYDTELFSRHKIQLSLEFNNLMDARTHTVTGNQLGLEPGRSIWLGLGYRY